MVAVAAGRSVGNHGNEGDHFVWHYNELKLMIVMILLKGRKERSKALIYIFVFVTRHL